MLRWNYSRSIIGTADHRTVLDDLGTSLETEKEITQATTEKITHNTSTQVVKVGNVVDEEQAINYLSSNSPISESSHSLNYIVVNIIL
jgi:hypothetical protein